MTNKGVRHFKLQSLPPQRSDANDRQKLKFEVPDPVRLIGEKAGV